MRLSIHVSVFALAVLSFLNMGCQSCIQPTVKREHSDYNKQIDLSAKLEHFQASGSLKTDFKKTVDKDYVELSDKHQGIELLLKAAECYKKQGWKVDEIQQIFTVILTLMRENEPVGQKGGGPMLTDADREYISKGKNADRIFQLLEELGLNK